MTDILKEVLLAVEQKKSVPNLETNWPVIKLISYKKFDSSYYERIHHFQKQIKDKFLVDLIAIGGGYGCTTITFAIEARTNKEAMEFVLSILGSEEFRSLGSEAEFKIALSNDPYVQSDLSTGELKLGRKAKEQLMLINLNGGELSIMGSQKNITKIEGDVKNSNVAIDSDNSKFQIGNNFENEKVTELLKKMYTTLKSDSSLEENTKNEAFEQIEAVQDESTKEKPKRSLLKSYAESLQSIESISDSVNKLLILLGIST